MSCKVNYIRDNVFNEDRIAQYEAKHISIVKELLKFTKKVGDKLYLSVKGTQKRLDQAKSIDLINEREDFKMVTVLEDDSISVNVLKPDSDIEEPFTEDALSLGYIPDEENNDELNKDLLIKILENEISKIEKRKSFLKDRRNKEVNPRERVIINRQLDLLDSKIESIEANIALITETDNTDAIISIIEDEVSRLSLDTQNRQGLTDTELNDYTKLANTFLLITSLEDNHPLFNDDVLDTQSVRESLATLYDNVARIKRELVRESDRRLTNDLNEKFDTNFTIRDLKRSIADKDNITVNTMSIDRLGNEILDYIYKLMQDAKTAFLKATRSAYKEIDDMFKGVTDFTIFQQEDKDGNLTGNLIHFYSQEYWDTRNNYTSAIKKAKTFTEKINARKRYHKWRSQNTTLLTPTLLSNPNERMRLVNLLGEQQLSRLEVNMEEELEKYNLLLEEKLIELQNEPDINKRRYLLTKFDALYNPLKGGGVTKVEGVNIYNISNMPYVPIEKYFDPKWLRIKENPKLLKAYQFMIETNAKLRDLLPPHLRKNFQVNTLPYLKESILDKFKEKGLLQILDKSTYDFIAEALKESSGDIQGDVDPLTNSVELKTQIHLSNDKFEIQKLYDYYVSYAKVNNVPLTSELKKALLAKATDEVAKNKSWNIPSLMKVYMLAVNSYYYTTLQEEKVLQAHNIIKSKSELKISGDRTIEDQSGLKNIKELTEYQIKRFFGIKTTKVEGKLDKKVYNNDESKLKKELEQLKAKELAKENIDTDLILEIQKQINRLGSNTSLGKIGESLLKFVHVKALGWNILSGISNTVFGRLANYLEAASGRFFKEDSLKKGYYLAGAASVGKNNKIGNIIYQLDVIKDGANELETIKTSGSEKLSILSPYKLNQLAETINQGASTVAYLIENNLLEKFNELGIFQGTEEELSNIKTVITKMNNMIHGNYDTVTSQMGKKTVLGKAMFMFKTVFLQIGRAHV